MGMKCKFKEETLREPKWQERLKIFAITSFLKTTMSIIIPKFWETKNLQLMYDFDFNNYLDAYLCSHNLEKHFCRIPKHQL